MRSIEQASKNTEINKNKHGVAYKRRTQQLKQIPNVKKQKFHEKFRTVCKMTRKKNAYEY